MSLGTSVMGAFLPPEASAACLHCDKTLRRDAPAEVHIWGVLAKCTSCGCMTPFEFEGRFTKKQQRRKDIETKRAATLSLF